MKWRNFEIKEFECKCGCQTNDISVDFINKLQKARNIAEQIDKENCVFSINSGCRCKKHNDGVGGKENSRHLSGEIGGEIRICDASDIAVNDDHHRSVILLSLVYAGFTHFGIGSNFIHVDMSEKIGTWLYK